MKKVVILGGGFAGINCAKKLARSKFDITIIDKTNHHLFQPLLYQVATAALSPSDIAVPIRNIFKNNKNVKVILGNVVTIDKENKKVILKSNKVFHFDYLVICTGAKHSYFGNNEWKKFSNGLKTIDDALDIREKILIAFEKAERENNEKTRQKHLNFVIVGGGPTGVEMAGSIAEIAYNNLAKDFRNFKTSESRIYLIEAGPKILPMFDNELSEKARLALIKFGVIVKTNDKVTNISKGIVETTSETIESDTIIWAAGNKASSLLDSLDDKKDNQNRVIVNQDCSLDNHPNIFVIGDAAHFATSDGPLPGVAPVAIQQGNYVGKIIKKDPKSRPDFKYFDKGIMATIGRSKAVVKIGNFGISGLIAWLVWSIIHIVYLIGFRTKAIVLIEWIAAYIFNNKGTRLIYRFDKK